MPDNAGVYYYRRDKWDTDKDPDRMIRMGDIPPKTLLMIALRCTLPYIIKEMAQSRYRWGNTTSASRHRRIYKLGALAEECLMGEVTGQDVFEEVQREGFNLRQVIHLGNPLMHASIRCAMASFRWYTKGDVLFEVRQALEDMRAFLRDNIKHPFNAEHHQTEIIRSWHAWDNIAWILGQCPCCTSDTRSGDVVESNRGRICLSCDLNIPEPSERVWEPIINKPLNEETHVEKSRSL